MSFNSVEFIFFFTLVPIVYYLLKGRTRIFFLLACSYGFYMAWKPAYIFIILLSTFVDYFISARIHREEEQGRRRQLLFFSIAINLGLLFFFKYYHFASENLEGFAAVLNYSLNLPKFDFLLPVGISFYTFQTISYTVDVYKKRIEPEKSFWNFALFVSFFPQLVAGPIERAKNLLPQFETEKKFDFQRAGDGLLLILWGLFLKVFIANRIGVFVDQVFSAMTPENHGWNFLLASYGYAFQLFLDFAAYSTIAVGAAKVLGIHLMTNFRAPFFATSIAGFWNRWHISLSNWFRDYVYSPLLTFFSRKTVLKKLSLNMNTSISFVLSISVAEILVGFWHGASWNFGLFGMYHAVLLVLTHFNRRRWETLPFTLKVFITFQLTVIGTTVFRIPSLHDEYYVFSNLLTGHWHELALIFTMGLTMAVLARWYKQTTEFIIRFREKSFLPMMAFFLWGYLLLFLLFKPFEVELPKSDAFIYFQF